MASNNHSKLPDGELFLISDQRAMGTTLSSAGAYDPDPQETEAIKVRRAAHYKTFEPDWVLSFMGSGQDLFHRSYPATPPIGPDLVHKQSGFNRPKPQRGLGDNLYFPFRDYATENAYYRVVSPEWKAAVESLEPGVHEFFGHEVVFSDSVWQRYIFRDRQRVEIFAESTLPPGSKIDIARFRGCAKRHAVAGRHWVRPLGWSIDFVSRELASRLLPLMTGAMSFIPVQVED